MKFGISYNYKLSFGTMWPLIYSELKLNVITYRTQLVYDTQHRAQMTFWMTGWHFPCRVMNFMQVDLYLQ
jgi:hypothetical protein